MLAVLGTMLGVRVWMVESLHASPQLSLCCYRHISGPASFYIDNMQHLSARLSGIGVLVDH